MIVQTRENKNLIIPKSLGNFSTNGGGTGGVTPEEAAEIASAVTEAAIDAYDADLQDDLNSIRTAVSGNTDDIVALAGDVAAFAGNVSALSASTESGLQSANAAASAANTLAGSAYTRADAAYALAQEAKPFGIRISTTEPTDWTQEDIEALTAMRQHLYESPYDAAQGSYISVGGVLAGRIYTLEHFDAESNAIFSASEGDWSGYFYLNLRDVMESYFAEHNSASSNDLEELSAATEVLSASTESGLRAANDAADSAYTLASSAYTLASSAYTCGDSANTKVEALSAATEALSDSIKTIYVDLSDGSTGAQVYAKIDSAYTAGKEVILRAIDDNYKFNGTQVLLPFSRKNGSDYYFQGTWNQESIVPNLHQYFVKIKSDGTTEGTKTYNNIIYAYRQSLLTHYSLPTAAANTKGGVKVGSGLTMNGEVMSVAIGDGLAYSGNSIVVSGGSSSGPEVYLLNKLSQQELIDLYTLIKSYYDDNTQSFTSAWTEDAYAFFIDLRDYSDQQAFSTTDHYEGFFPMRAVRCHPTDYGGAVFFTGVEGDREGNGHLINIRFVITYDGQVDKGTWWNSPSQLPEMYICRFGNDEKGGLTYDAYNDVFYYNNATIPTGDTTTVYDDLIDNNITDWLISGERIVINNNALTVTWGDDSQADEVYTHPIVKKYVMPAPMPIDGQDFYKEITYNYGNYVLNAYYGANDGNNAAYLTMRTP